MSMSDRRLRFAVVNEVLADGPRWSDHVRRIEQSGASALLVRDHIASEPYGPQLAPLAMASAADAQTTRLRVGTMVLGNDYRHPALVAHEAATIDWLSGGRFELGLGAGWLRGEYEQMGLSFDAARRASPGSARRRRSSPPYCRARPSPSAAPTTPSTR